MTLKYGGRWMKGVKGYELSSPNSWCLCRLHSAKTCTGGHSVHRILPAQQGNTSPGWQEVCEVWEEPDLYLKAWSQKGKSKTLNKRKGEVSSQRNCQNKPQTKGTRFLKQRHKHVLIRRGSHHRMWFVRKKKKEQKERTGSSLIL